MRIRDKKQALSSAGLHALRDLDRGLPEVRNQFRQRGGGIVYDDAYGVETEADLIASAEQAFLAYDRAEAEHDKRQPR